MYFCYYSFVCPEFHEFDKEKCYFNGKSFSVGEQIPVESYDCIDSCKCVKNEKGRSVIDFSHKSELERPVPRKCGFNIRYSLYRNLRSCGRYRYVCGK